MENKTISENVIKDVLYSVLNEETSKVKRDEYNRLQYKLEELQNSLNETLKEFRKVDDCTPGGLKMICKGRMGGISTNLSNAQKLLVQLKEKVRQHKKLSYQQSIEEKKK